jgi:phospholipid/cholesterol/gamma-HCH transport system ATP-binding protein
MSDGYDAVVFDHVSKTFGAKQVLRDVSFRVGRGEALCILGRSGTGKSVTLKLMISLLSPDSGRIWIDREETTAMNSHDISRVRRKMGFLFQDAALFDSYTLYDNLALPLQRLTQKRGRDADEVIDRVLHQVGLAADRDKMPAEMSGGMRKRAGLARALMLEPCILLVDEPSSGLDRITAAEIDDLMLKQKVEKGTTLVIVTHDVHGARRIGDRFIVLDQGNLAASGSAADLEHGGNETARRLISER